jgi:hypothetical protein
VSRQIFYLGVCFVFCHLIIETSERNTIEPVSFMTAKPNYEDLEKRVTSLTREVATCRNLQRFLHQAEETAKAEGKNRVIFI